MPGADTPLAPLTPTPPADPEVEARHEHLVARARLNPECQTHAVVLAMLLDGQGKDHKTMNRCTILLMSVNPPPSSKEAAVVAGQRAQASTFVIAADPEVMQLSVTDLLNRDIGMVTVMFVSGPFARF